MVKLIILQIGKLSSEMIKVKIGAGPHQVLLLREIGLGWVNAKKVRICLLVNHRLTMLGQVQE